jgi:hypothetical protein
MIISPASNKHHLIQCHINILNTRTDYRFIFHFSAICITLKQTGNRAATFELNSGINKIFKNQVSGSCTTNILNSQVATKF